MTSVEHDRDDDRPNLDTVARRAAADLRAAAAVAVADDGGAGAASATAMVDRLRSRRFNRAVLSVTVVAVALIAVGVAVLRGDDETVVADGGGGSSLHLVPSEVPDDLELLGASEIVAGGPEVESFGTWEQVWGDAGAPDPFAADDLLVVVFDVDEGAGDAIQGAGERVTVAGGDGALADLPDGSRALTYAPTDDRLVSLSSRSLDDARLVAIGDGARFEPGSTALHLDAATMPEGLTALATLDPSFHAFGGIITRAGWAGAAVRWQGPDGPGLTLAATRPVDDEVVLRNRYGLGADPVPVTVGGRPGWRSADGQQVLWRASNDVLVQLTAHDQRPADEVLAIAESVGPVDDETWDALQPREVGEESTATTTSAGPTDEHGIPLDTFRLEVPRPGGGTFVVYVDDEDMVCGTRIGDETGFGACVGGNGPQVAYDDEGRPDVVWGRAGPGVAEVRTVVDGVTATSAIADPDGSRLWLLDLPAAGIVEGPDEVVEYDASGAEVRRQSLGPGGDPPSVSPTPVLGD